MIFFWFFSRRLWVLCSPVSCPCFPQVLLAALEAMEDIIVAYGDNLDPVLNRLVPSLVGATASSNASIRQLAGRVYSQFSDRFFSCYWFCSLVPWLCGHFSSNRLAPLLVCVLPLCQLSTSSVRAVLLVPHMCHEVTHGNVRTKAFLLSQLAGWMSFLLFVFLSMCGADVLQWPCCLHVCVHGCVCVCV